jgi:ATP-dependent RNA helicase DHX37/DHR1
METILENDVTVLCSETGSGKTTQLPQFLYEAGFGHPNHPKYSGIIGITQPRRVAAVSMASRVGFEMNLRNGEVAYQIRYDRGQLSSKTRIKFMTDGILLRELSQNEQSTSNSRGLLLTDYSCIIIDEAHERTVGTDILLGWLTRIVKLRNSHRLEGVKPLKLIIMSATLRVEDFTENHVLFPSGPPPVINIPGRQHKVAVHYNRKTNIDYIEEAFKKASKIHSRMPQGGILIFVTGQQEVQKLVRQLKNAFPSTTSSHSNDPVERLDGRKCNDLGLLEEGDELSDDDVDIGNSSDFDVESVNSDDEEEEIHILNGDIENEDGSIFSEKISETKNRGNCYLCS